MVAWRYSDWDGTQEIPPLDPDDVLEALTDDLMNFGDLQHAMRNLLQRGMRDNMGNRLQGLRDMYGIRSPAPICPPGEDAAAFDALCQTVFAPHSPERLVADAGHGPIGEDNEIRLTYRELSALIEAAVKELK